MIKLIEAPTVVKAAGNKPKQIEEFVVKASEVTPRVPSGGHMKRPILTLLAVVLTLSNCGRKEPPPVAKEAPASQKAPAIPVPAAATAGGDFNKFFPPAKEGSFERTFTQEKAGFALAEILRDGKKVALLSVVDLASSGENPGATSSRSLAGFPATDTGSLQTSVIVGGRYKVVARSMDGSFSQADRDRLIARVDLKGLASLAGGSK